MKPPEIGGWKPRRVIVQVTSLDEARAALAAGADALIAKGNESGGRVDDETTFVLLQRLVAELPGVDVWAQGGIGLHTAASCLAGGAAFLLGNWIAAHVFVMSLLILTQLALPG